MKFNIAAFTHIGTVRSVNQDRILVNDKLLQDGTHRLDDQPFCYCFVADGIGGSSHGEIASQFVLEKIYDLKQKMLVSDTDEIHQILLAINFDLLGFSGTDVSIKGTGTTLTGLMIDEMGENLAIHAGDSELWAFKNHLLFKLTDDQVFDDSEPGSPLISYFGGFENHLNLNVNSSMIRKINDRDIFIVCSDGFFNSLTPKNVREVLLDRHSLYDKSNILLDKALTRGSNDNISCILIEVSDLPS